MKYIKTVVFMSRNVVVGNVSSLYGHYTIVVL